MSSSGPLIDPANTTSAVDERLRTETDPVLRANLELLARHMRAEAALDLDELMATVSPQARYVFNTDRGPSQVLEGKEAVRRFYTEFAASGAHRLQHQLTRLYVDKGGIYTEGVLRMAYPGRALMAMGHPVDDPDAYYLYEANLAIVWPIADDGLFVGEDSFVAGDGFAGIADRKLDPADIHGF